MVELTIEITNYCPYNCPFCSSNASPEGKPLEFEKIKEFLLSYKDITSINISGGEPLSHPDFWKIRTLCKKLCSTIWIYTCAIENIAYNTHVLKEINVKANVCLVPNSEVYIPKGSFHINLLKFVSQGRGKNIKPVETHFSGNITGNCNDCNNPTLLASGKVVSAPCKKEERGK